ncbi:hypothetical protein [Curvibacter sp. PAE-UM]|uniref:hypothetical protein n=1 Tax=Curvibacter sp. PAE-UM TaxID=1714344 RepID=UPI00196A1B45|nr:hypothetical protein [Curvibacter sp. PAE-UM]
MYKQVARRPDWIKAPNVGDIYSLSGCVSKDFADYINFWRHNGYWLFDSPRIIEEIALANSIPLDGLSLFYYEAHEEQYDADDCVWTPFAPEQSFETNIEIPQSKTLQGFDVTTFLVQTSPECSPLSCNSLAEGVATNEHCLLATFDEAQELVEKGVFTDAEPGPYRIIAVYTVERNSV